MCQPPQGSPLGREFLRRRTTIAPVVELFHYHLVTSSVREVEARYLGKLGFRLVARYGRIGEDQVHYEAGVSWEDLEEVGFRHRLSELERGAVNIVVQPGQWQLPRVDHVGVALDDDEFQEVLERATDLRLRVQEYPGRRTFVATEAGYRLEVHPQRDWIDELLAGAGELRLSELQLRADDPDGKAAALARLLELDARQGEVTIGETTVRFLPSGPRGRPELYGELFA
jgi:catechol 2,3-dioxygenase-like lactoylglutathione lyase family enzyme